MKTKITNKQAKECANLVLIPYCDLQSLLDNGGIVHPCNYHCGVYGWNYDLYSIYFPVDESQSRYQELNIVTGYRSFPSTAKRLPREMVRKYEDAAREIRGRKIENWENYTAEMAGRRKEAENLLFSFCREALDYIKNN